MIVMKGVIFMKNIQLFSFFLVCILAMPFGSIAQPFIVIKQTGRPSPWSHLNTDSASNPLIFAVVADRNGGMRKGIFEKAVKKLNFLNPHFVMCVGDLAEGHKEDSTTLEREFDEFDSIISGLRPPFFYLPGNHDQSSELQKKIWNRRYGMAYYHFVYRNILFLCLNTEDPFYGGIGSREQLDYIKATLREHESVSWTFVFMHRPIWGYSSIFDSVGLHKNAHSDHPKNGANGWKELDIMLAARKHTIFAGHEHLYRCDTVNGLCRFVLATTGGGSALRGAEFGEFDHFLLVNISGKEPEYSNILLDGMVDGSPEIFFTRKGGRGRELFSIQNINAIIERKESRMDTVIHISNNMAVPISVQGFVTESSYGTAVAPKSFSLQIPPLCSVGVALSISFPKESRKGQWDSWYYIDCFATYKVDGEKSKTISNKTAVNIYRPYEVVKTSKAAVTGGRLLKWGKLSNTIDIKVSPAGDSRDAVRKEPKAEFDFRYDNSYLYFCAIVRDEKIVGGIDSVPVYKQDGIQFYIDPRPGIERVLKGDYRSQKIDILVSPGEVDGAFHTQKPLPDGVICAVTRIKKGYSVEIAIPHEKLNAYQNGSWEDFGFNLMVNDIGAIGEEKIVYALRSIEGVWENSRKFATFRKM